MLNQRRRFGGCTATWAASCRCDAVHGLRWPRAPLDPMPIIAMVCSPEHRAHLLLSGLKISRHDTFNSHRRQSVAPRSGQLLPHPHGRAGVAGRAIGIGTMRVIPRPSTPTVTPPSSGASI